MWGKYGVKDKSESKNLVGDYLEKDTLTFYLRGLQCHTVAFSDTKTGGPVLSMALRLVLTEVWHAAEVPLVARLIGMS
jgi:hypothetical protein